MKQILYFLGGAAAGSILTWYLTKRYYENIADEEIESVKEAYKVDQEKEEETEKSTGDKKIYRANVRTLGYSTADYDRIVPIDEEDVDENGVKIDKLAEELHPGEGVDYPYTIGPDIYHEGDIGVFDKITVTYWAGNDLLVTDEDEILEVNDTIGSEALGMFGEYEEDTVFVRNERLGSDFEVIRVDGVYDPNE